MYKAYIYMFIMYMHALKLIVCIFAITANKNPPISTFPSSHSPSLPDGITCGAVSEGSSGTLYSPSYPSPLPNQDCAWVIKVPDGYSVELSFPDLRMQYRYFKN